MADARGPSQMLVETYLRLLENPDFQLYQQEIQRNIDNRWKLQNERVVTPEMLPEHNVAAGMIRGLQLALALPVQVVEQWQRENNPLRRP